FGGLAEAQVTNLAAFDQMKIHFGIQLGYTQSKFDLYYTEDPHVRDKEQGTTSYYAPGFHLAILADRRLGRHFNLRTMPGLTLINRSINFMWDPVYQAGLYNLEPRRQVESVYGELPIDLKFRSMRWRNFRPYLTTGLSYGFDFASLRNNKNNNNQSIIRLNTSDLRYTCGIGFDFYLRYVKFAIELKMAFGIVDLRIDDDDDLYTQSYDFLHSRTFILGFTFEGMTFP
ncbi:MAG: outer membrane beta-barrel protein, partial [Bacteroidales bacterium]|nr:outer membrane beta-barrel protein [Bacteroidales bacterium]